MGWRFNLAKKIVFSCQNRIFATTFKFRTRYGNDRVTPDGSFTRRRRYSILSCRNHNLSGTWRKKAVSMGYHRHKLNSLAIEYDLYQKSMGILTENHIAVQSMGG